MAAIGFASGSISEDVWEALAFAIEHGFRGIELSLQRPTLLSLTGDQRQGLRDQAAAHSIRCSLHFRHAANPGTHDPEERAQLYAEFEEVTGLARDIGAGVLVMHPGRISRAGTDAAEASDEVRREALENEVEFFRTLAPGIGEAGISICLENMWHRPGDVIRSYEDLVELVLRIGNDAIGIVLDTGHAHLTSGLDRAFDVFRPYLRHLHVSDWLDGEDHHEIGGGGLDLGRQRELLKASDMTMIFEIAKGVERAARHGRSAGDVVLASRRALQAMLDGETG